MKRKLLSLGFAALFLASCSSDDSPSYEQSQLLKKWYNVSSVISGVEIPYQDHETCGKDYIEFLANGTANAVDVYSCESGATPSVDNAPYALKGNKITVISGDDINELTIIKLNETTLHLKIRVDFDDDGDLDTIVEKFTSVNSVAQ